MFETPGPISVVLEVPLGDLRIRASQRHDTIVEVRASDPTDDGSVAAVEETRIELAGDRLRISPPKQRGLMRLLGPFGASGYDIDIELPEGSSVRLTQSMGDVRCTGRLGECRLAVRYGDISVEEAASLEISTSAGEVSVGRISGDADVKTSAGEIRIQRIDGTATVSGPNGDVRIGEVTGNLQVSSANAEIRVDRAEGDVEAKSAYGSVWLHEVVRGRVTLSTSSGELHVGVRKGTAAWLDVSSQYGEVSSSLGELDGPDEFSETVEIRAQTSYGNISIFRA